MDGKPLGHKNYGHIAHLPNSRMGPGDHKCSPGQAKIACEKARDRHDRIIVQEKLDGSNVGVAKKDGVLYPLTRAGLLASSSRFLQHQYFHRWVFCNYERFFDILNDGERLCGEWLLVAHGTKYDLPHEPFVAFDIMINKHNRLTYDDFLRRVNGSFITPHVLSDGPPISIDEAMCYLGVTGHHGAIEQVEGAVWRVERSMMIDKSKGNIGGRKPVVDFLVKYVRPDKVDGKYLDGKTVYNNHT